MKGASIMGHTKVSMNRNWYGKVPLDKNGKPIPRNLWPKRRKYSWEVRWFSSEGKRYSKSFKERKEAYEYVKTVQEKVDKGRANRPQKITIEKFIKEHERIMVGQVAYTTLKDHLRALRLFENHIGQQTQLKLISPRDAESFVAARLADKLSVGSVNKDIRTLKGIFNVAIEPRGYLAEGTNPFAKIKQRKMAAKPPRYVSAEDFDKVFEASGSLWWKAFLALAYTSAGRRDELLNLTWVDIDFENQNLCFFPKRASKLILAWEPKDHESRIVPIPPEVVQLLANLQVESNEVNPYVFIKTNRLKHILRRRSEGTWQSDYEIVNNLCRSMEVICRRAKTELFTPHDLRRTCITNWAKKLPIQTVQHLAGHSNMMTTRKYYLSVQRVI
jgi:integrase